MVKPCLITGGAGAIGSRLANALSATGAPVVILDDLSTGRLDNIEMRPNIRFIQGRVESDDDLRRALERPIGAVFHLAASFANLRSVLSPERDLEVNGMGTLKLLLHCSRHKVERFLYASSSSVYAPREAALLESPLEYSVDTPYSVSKLLGESYVRYFARSEGLKAVILRYFNVYGPGEYPGPHRNVIANFVLRAMRGEDLSITGTGAETRDFTFVDDIVRGTIAASERDAAIGGIFNIASGRETPIQELAELVVKTTGSRSRIIVSGPRSWDSVKRRSARLELARVTLGYQPRVALAEGVARYHEWLRQRDLGGLADE